jgi:hypothetical protein
MAAAGRCAEQGPRLWAEIAASWRFIASVLHHRQDQPDGFSLRRTDRTEDTLILSHSCLYGACMGLMMSTRKLRHARTLSGSIEVS